MLIYNSLDNFLLLNFPEMRVRDIFCKETAKDFSFSELLFLNNSQTDLKIFNKFLLYLIFSTDLGLDHYFPLNFPERRVRDIFCKSLQRGFSV